MNLFAQAEDRFTSMARQMGRWMEQALRPQYHKYCPGEAWTPSVNAYETADGYTIVVELAGMQPEEIDLRVEDGDPPALVLEGRRDPPCLPKKAGKFRLHLMEIDHGDFCRTLRLPGNVASDRIEARTENGFLRIRLPKATRS